MGRAIVSFFLALLAVGVLAGLGAEAYQAGVAQGIVDAGRFPAGATVPVVGGYGGSHGFDFLGLLFPLLFLFLIFGLIRGVLARSRLGPRLRPWLGRGHGWGPGWDKERGGQAPRPRGARSASGGWRSCTAGSTKTEPGAGSGSGPGGRDGQLSPGAVDIIRTGAAAGNGSRFGVPATRVTAHADRARRR